MKAFGLVLGLMLFASAGFAEDRPAGGVGDHSRILVFKKNENPQNIMIVYTKLDSHCRIQRQGAQPLFDFYWLMNGRDYKPVHSMIKDGIRERLQLDAKRVADPKTSFWVNLNDMKEMNHDLENPRLLVRSSKDSAGRCAVEALITLGASDRKAVVRLTDIYAEATKTFLPPFRRVVAVTVNGVDVKTGKKISRTYRAK